MAMLDNRRPQIATAEDVQEVRDMLAEIRDMLRSQANPTPQWLTTQEAAKLLGVNPVTMLRRKHLYETRRAGNALLFNRASLPDLSRKGGNTP